MSRPFRHQLKDVLNSLKVTQRELLEHDHVTRGVFTSVDDLQPRLVRASRTRSPLSWLWEINLDTLNTKLEAELKSFKVGYCYMLKSDGALVHGRSSGFAQLEDDGEVGWAYHVPMNVCSLSKFITAMATIKLLPSAGIFPTTKISSYLPDYWNPGTNVSNITFRDLLRHESGLGGSFNMGGNFSSGPGDFVTTRQQVELGSTGTGSADYKNLNFTLLRVLFATLTGTLATDFQVTGGVSEDTVWDYASAMAYCNYVNDNIFAAASIAPRGFKPDDIAAKAYGTPPAAPGVREENATSEAGSTGWHLSLGELTRLLHEFRRGGSIMSPRQAERLMSNLYGLDGAEDMTVGPVYRKNGRYNDGGTHTMDTVIYLMPNNTELAIYINSGPGNGPTQATYLARIPQLIRESIELRFSL